VWRPTRAMSQDYGRQVGGWFARLRSWAAARLPSRGASIQSASSNGSGTWGIMGPSASIPSHAPNANGFASAAPALRKRSHDTVRMGRHRRVPLSYAELAARRHRLSRALFEPLLYLFFLACYIVMLQLLPTLRSYGERENIEDRIDALFGKGGRAGAAVVSNRGFGPVTTGSAEPGLCPGRALWSPMYLVDPVVTLPPTSQEWLRAIQASRTFHRPTGCAGCSFDDARLHADFELVASWMDIRMEDGVPRSELGYSGLTFGLRLHQSLVYDYTPVEALLTRNLNVSEFVGSDVSSTLPVHDFDMLESVTKSELNWHFSQSGGYSIGGSARVHELLELGCKNGDKDACEAARRYSTTYHNINDVCSPLLSTVIGSAMKALTDDPACDTLTTVGLAAPVNNTGCSVDLALEWNMLLRSSPHKARASTVAGGSSIDAALAEDATRGAHGTDSTYVLVSFSGEQNDLEFTFLPTSLYPGAQGVALLVFQCVFCVFTLFFTVGPVFGRLWLIERSARGAVPSPLRRTRYTLRSAFSHKWMWYDLLTLGSMATTIGLYAVFVRRYNDLTGSECSSSGCGLDVGGLPAMGTQEWDDITRYCCAQTILTSLSFFDGAKPFESLVNDTYDIAHHPFCCSSMWGTCQPVCSEERLAQLTSAHYVPDDDKSARPAFIRDSLLRLVRFPASQFDNLGSDWIRSPPPSGEQAKPYVPAPEDLSRSCVSAGPAADPARVPVNVTWCGTANGNGGCTCNVADCKTLGNCCDDIDAVCGTNAPELPEGWLDVDWANFTRSNWISFTSTPPLGVADEFSNLENVSHAAISQAWDAALKRWGQQLTLPYDSYSDAFAAASNAEENWIIALAFSSVLLFARVLKYAEIDARMSLLLRTLSIAAGTLLFYMVSGALLFMGWVFFAQAYNGWLLLPGYTTFFQAFTSVFNLLFDPFPNEDFPSSGKWPFWVWYFLFMLIVTIVALNLVVAILVSAFETARDYAIHARRRHTRTIGAASSEWLLLGQALKYRDGRPDMAAVYSYFSGLSCEEVVQRATVVQTRWRGFKARLLADNLFGARAWLLRRARRHRCLPEATALADTGGMDSSPAARTVKHSAAAVRNPSAVIGGERSAPRAARRNQRVLRILSRQPSVLLGPAGAPPGSQRQNDSRTDGWEDGDSGEDAFEDALEEQQRARAGHDALAGALSGIQVALERLEARQQRLEDALLPSSFDVT